ncbi:MAG TPA: hypothetical protein VEO56_14740, partial [Bacteroidota bacterium]|nr:hypothetical protein [Bacteroidota bacterium]
MKKWFQSCALALLVACAFSSALSGTLSTEQRARIHRNFQALLSTVYPDQTWQPGNVRRLSRDGLRPESNQYHAIVYTADPSIVRASGATVVSTYDGFVTALVTPDQVLKLAQSDGIRFIDAGATRHKVNDVSIPETGATLLQGGLLNATDYMGSGVIIILYDTGIDWKHLDFRSPTDPTKSRILFIWDQTLTPQAG